MYCAGSSGLRCFYSFQTYIGMSYEEAKRAVLVFRDDYEAGGMYRSRVYDGLPELIARLRQNGVKTAVATLKPEATAKQLLHHFGMEGLFDACTGNTPDENDQTTKADIIRRTMRRRMDRLFIDGADRRFRL